MNWIKFVIYTCFIVNGFHQPFDDYKEIFIFINKSK